MKKRLVLLIALLAVLGAIAFAATHTPWDGTMWDVASPDIDQPIGNHYKELYDLRKGVALRMNKEHETLATASAGGVHKQGSARAFFQDAAPTTQVNGDAFDSGDLGSLWFDSDSTIDNCYYVLTATTPTWTPVSTEIIATLLAANRTFAGTLTVDGTLGVTGDVAVNTDKFTVTAATGNTLVAGTFESTGVATLADASLTKTSAAPTTDAMITNKKYVDDAIAAAVPVAALCKGWAMVDGDGTLKASYNVTSSAQTATGAYTVTWDTDFSSAFYCVVATVQNDNGHDDDEHHSISVLQCAAGYTLFEVMNNDGTPGMDDPSYFHVAAYGSQ